VLSSGWFLRAEFGEGLFECSQPLFEFCHSSLLSFNQILELLKVLLSHPRLLRHCGMQPLNRRQCHTIGIDRGDVLVIGSQAEGGVEILGSEKGCDLPTGTRVSRSKLDFAQP